MLRRTILSLALLLPACAGRTPAPESPSTPAAQVVDGAVMQPPAFEPIQAAQDAGRDPSHPGSVRSQVRQAIFEGAWTSVRDKHFDKNLGGLDWNSLRTHYEPLALAAPDEPTFYRLVNEMLGQLGQSHLQVHGPGEEAVTLDERDSAKSHETVVEIGGVGDPGLLVRIIEGKPTITRVRAESAAARAGLAPGFLVTHVGGQALDSLPRSGRALRPVEERFRLRQSAARLLSGPSGSAVSVRYIDNDGKAGEALLHRDPPSAPPRQVLNMAAIVPEVKVSQVGQVGVIAFNVFLLDPVLTDVQKAIDGFRGRGVRALILDLRGNPGGIGPMAIPVAARLVSKPTTLGTIQYRDFSNTLATVETIGAKPFTGRVFILTDEGTASTSEILAAGLQEAGRAQVVGDTSAGAALGSIIQDLPGGALIQIPVADFRTPKGQSIEGRGVQPDRRVLETRAALRGGRDVVLDAALDMARASGTP